MKVLTIERSKWLRGHVEESYLRDDQGRMCCLGFDAVACGLTPEQITWIAEPSELDTDGLPEEYIRHRFMFDREAVSMPIEHAIRINDDSSYLHDSDREAALIPVLKQLGYDDVQFID